MAKFITKCLFLLFALHFSASAQTTSRVVCDENCKTESGATVVKGDGFAVVSPVVHYTNECLQTTTQIQVVIPKNVILFVIGRGI